MLIRLVCQRWQRAMVALMLAAAALVSLLPGQTRADNSVRVSLDGLELQFDVPGQIDEGRTLVPFRGIFEALGAEVSWDPDARKVTAVRGSDTLELTIDSHVVIWRRAMLKIDVAPKIIDGRTMVPLRFIGQALGIHVDWDASERMAVLSTTPDSERLARGIQTVKDKGCMVCHRIHGVGGWIAPALNGVTQRHTQEWLAEWLRDPQAIRPGTEMPRFGFSEEEIAAVITFLRDMDGEAP